MVTDCRTIAGSPHWQCGLLARSTKIPIESAVLKLANTRLASHRYAGGFIETTSCVSVMRSRGGKPLTRIRQIDSLGQCSRLILEPIERAIFKNACTCVLFVYERPETRWDTRRLMALNKTGTRNATVSHGDSTTVALSI